ncbi:hypothetical protein GCM10025780_30100 [Frondihabitans cladoniiphilus]|uniref:Oxidoreductase n=1 Tax=Frondihabitans cladoniiphilus TaxID=715785 RepID=A0ABP8W659_9MICO
MELARRYADSEADVFITGRPGARFDNAQASVQGSKAIPGDLSRPEDREHLAEVIRSGPGALDVLVNNAGIQRRVSIAADKGQWQERQQELDLLLAAPIHLVHLLTPLLLTSDKPNQAKQIVNVTSGGAFFPQVFAPAYSAAKAALHSYTENLRFAFANTAVAVTELIPPAVATGLGDTGPGHGADLDAFIDEVFPQLELRSEYVGYGPTAAPDFRSRLAADHDRFLATSAQSDVLRH